MRLGSQPAAVAAFAAVVGVALVLAPGRVAEASCDDVVRAWARRCPPARDHCVAAVACPDARVIVRAGCDRPTQVDVEIGAARASSFRDVDGVGVSPVGSFADWNQEPKARRDAFEAVIECVGRDDSVWSADGPTETTSREPGATSARRAKLAVPWRFLLGAVLAGVVFLWRRRREPELVLARELWWLAGLTVLTGVVRAQVVPFAFFHQNGQGPLWIATALDPFGHRSQYGPGFWELFHGIAKLALASPETNVFVAQALLGALIPACAWLVMRCLGGPRALPWAAAGAAALSPLWARLAQSESYYGTWLVFLFGAAAVLSLGCMGQTHRRLAGTAMVAAGLLIAQAARITPLGWVPAATVPLVLCVGPGSLRARIALLAAATATIAVLVALLSGQAMWAVATGDLGRAWLPSAKTHAAVALPWVALSTLPVVAALIWASRDRLGALGPASALVLITAIAEITHLVETETSTINRAFLALWSPAWLAALAGLLVSIGADRLRTLALAALATACAGLFVLTGREDTRLSTDVLEIAWALGWRENLPAEASVLYFGRGPKGVLVLPIYGRGSRVPIEARVLRVGVPSLCGAGGSDYYYHSSLCATEEAGDACAAFESTCELERVDEAVLPAIASLPRLRYRGPTVTVALYRVLGARRVTPAP